MEAILSDFTCEEREETRKAEFRNKNGPSQLAVAGDQSWKEKLTAIHYISGSGTKCNYYVIKPVHICQQLCHSATYKASISILLSSTNRPATVMSTCKSHECRLR